MVVDLIIGTIGMLFILTAFVLDEFSKKWNQDTIRYNIINILGAGLLIYYAFTLNSGPFMILNTIWVLAAVIKLVRITRK